MVWIRRICSLIFGMLAFVFLVIGCRPNPREQINTYFDNLGNWIVTPEEDSRDPADTLSYTQSKPVSGQSYAVDYVYNCQLYDVSRSAMFDRVFVPGFSVADVLPGALIRGQALRDGQIAILPLERADIDLRVDVSIEDATLTVDSPAGPNEIYDAVTEIRRQADPRLNESNVDIIAANLEYDMVEAFSYEQAMLDIGLAAEYAGSSVQANFESAFSSERTAQTHTVMARLFHPMYTIVFDDSEISPADFFAPDVTMADIEQEEERGRLGADNLPLYIKSVTYGQMILFTISSTNVDSATELEAAVSAAVGAFKGSATLEQSSRNILQNSEIHVYSIGGDRETAFAALRDGNLSAFFHPAPATTAEVLYMTANTLDGKIATLLDRASFTERDCDRGTARMPDWWLVVENVENTYVYAERFQDDRHIRQFREGSGQILLTQHMYGDVNVFIVRNGNWTTGFGTTINLYIYRGSPSNPANKRYELRVDTGPKELSWVDIVTFRIYDNPTANCEIRMDYGEVGHNWNGQGAIWQSCS